MIGAASKIVVKSRSTMMVQQRRTFLDWMTNYPDRVRLNCCDLDVVNVNLYFLSRFIH